MKHKQTRSWRRHHNQRIKNKCKSYLIFAWVKHDVINDVISKRYNHVANCSCSCCGNQRHNNWLSKKEKMTIQERKSLMSFNDQLQDFFGK